MKQNPKMTRAEANKILAGRDEIENGTKWDKKIHNRTNLTYFELRYKVGDAAYYEKSFVAIAKQYGVSKSFVYKWYTIYLARMVIKNSKTNCKIISCKVFKSNSNRPKYVSSPIRDEIRKEVIEIRIKYPFFSSAKIKAKLGLNVSTSTIDKVLREEGLINNSKNRQMNKTYGSFERPHSLDLIQLDYKQWAPGVYSMFVIDDSSRFILDVGVYSQKTAENVIKLLEETFNFWKVYPKQILTDHGTEFYSVRGGKGESALAKWCEEKEIDLIHGRVRHPQTQGKIERSHLSAKVESKSFGLLNSVKNAKETLTKWVEFYNHERPHQSLNYDYPFNVFLEKLPERCAALIT